MNPSAHAHLLQANPTPVMTLREGLFLWDQAHVGVVKDVYRRRIHRVLAHRVLPALGNRRIDFIMSIPRQQVLHEALDWMQSLLTKGLGIPVGLEMKCLRTVLIWLHLNRYGDGAKALKVSLAHDRAPITPAMLEILLEAIDAEVSHDWRLKLFFRLVCGMGIRPKAALPIRHSHFSEGYRTLTVPEPMCSVFPVLQVPDSIRTILSELPIESDHGLIFPGNARAIHHRCQRLLSLALLKAGLDPRISFYRLRKMAA